MIMFNTNHQRAKKIQFDIDENNCFNCTSHKGNRYPIVQKYDKKTTIARHIYEECFGFIPDGMVIRHKCDNVKCINPEHLEIGTQADNNRDTRERGRFVSVRGEDKPQHKLTEKQVIKIRKDKRIGRLIMKDFNISLGYVYKIKNRKKWAWLK